MSLILVETNPAVKPTFTLCTYTHRHIHAETDRQTETQMVVSDLMLFGDIEVNSESRDADCHGDTWRHKQHSASCNVSDDSRHQRRNHQHGADDHRRRVGIGLKAGTGKDVTCVEDDSVHSRQLLEEHARDADHERLQIASVTTEHRRRQWSRLRRQRHWVRYLIKLHVNVICSSQPDQRRSSALHTTQWSR